MINFVIKNQEEKITHGNKRKNWRTSQRVAKIVSKISDGQQTTEFEMVAEFPLGCVRYEWIVSDSGIVILEHARLAGKWRPEDVVKLSTIWIGMTTVRHPLRHIVRYVTATFSHRDARWNISLGDIFL